jgi:hypothetical protein
MKTKTQLLFYLLLISAYAQSQIMFERHYGGSADDGGNCVMQTDDGGYLVAGYTKSFGVYWQDIYLIKTDAWGDTLWTKRIGKSEYGEMPYSMIKTNDNNFVVTGITSKIISGSYVHEVLLLKFNEYGDTLWYKNYGLYSENSGYDVKQTSDNGFIITGYTRNNATASSYVLLLKTDESGNEQWMKTYALRQSNGGTSIIQTNDGGYFLVGYSHSGSLESSDCLLIRANALGDTLWTKLYGGVNFDACVCGLETTSGNLFVLGNTKSHGNGGYNVFLSKLNASGDEIWIKTYGGNNDDLASMALSITDNSFILVGSTKSFGSGERDVYLIKTDLDGNEIWHRTFGGINDDAASYIQQTDDGGFILSGYTKSFGAGGFDVYLIKTDANGIAGFEKIFQAENQCFIYPNPSSDILNIQIHSFYDNDVRFNLFNINGQLAKSEILQNNGTGNFTINVSHLPKGVYILNIQTKTKQFNKKVIIH